MKRLHRLVITSFLGPFVMTFFIVLFLLLMQFLWRYIDELVGKGLGIDIIGEFLMYASAGLVPLALPLAILLSSLMTFGNMGEYYELTAIKASGISLQRIMMPVVFLVIIISTGSFFFSNNVVPITNLKMRTLRFDVTHLRPEVSITEGVFYNGLDNYSIRVGKKDPVTNILYDIRIYDHTISRGNPDVTIADSGRMKVTADHKNMIFTLWSGTKYTEVDEGRRRKDRRFPHRLLKFREEDMIIQMTGFEFSRTDDKVFKNSYQMLNVTQLRQVADSLRRTLFIKSRDFKNTLIKNSFFKINEKEGTVAKRFGSPSIQKPLGFPGKYPDADANSKRGLTAEAERRAAAIRSARLPREDLKTNSNLVQDTSTHLDTIKTLIVKTLKIKSFDSLYNSYSLDDKMKLLTDANNNVETNQYLVLATTSNMEYDTRNFRRHLIEWHRKFALSFACLIFLFIGAPLGAIIRKGGLGLPTVISTLLFIVYYIISLMGQKFVEEGLMTAFQGMWLSSFVLVIAGIFLTYQATNDSAILSLDTYMNWVREKAGLRKGQLLDNKAHILGKFELIEISRKDLQKGFADISTQAYNCIESLSLDAGWLNISKKSFENKGITYLVEFGIHYNSFIDQVILSKWFRIPYFQKRITEFPMLSGRITSHVFTKKFLRWIAVIVFPVALIRIIHLKFKIHIMRRNLKQVIDLSAGMINLLNSSAINIEADTV